MARNPGRLPGREGDRDKPEPGALRISPEFHPFISHLSELAREQDRMPFIGREKEIEAVMETLLRKLKKDIILVGKPGVGKTALITELAERINCGQVPGIPARQGHSGTGVEFVFILPGVERPAGQGF